jgi:dihydroorotase
MKKLIVALAVASVTILIFGCGDSSQKQTQVYERKFYPPQEEGKYDVLLKGGHVIDPANNISSKMDVAVTEGKIARVDTDIPASEAKKTVDVTGYYVTPGLIDIHVHCFSYYYKKTVSIIADHHSIQYGVTTVGDAGTCGAEHFEQFKEEIDNSLVRILAFLNISETGMDEGESDPSSMNVKRAVETAKKYPEYIVGFKTAHYGGGEYEGDSRPWTSVDSVLAAGRLAGLPCMFDVHMRKAEHGQPERSYRELLLEKMRPGDIHTHNYAAQFPVIQEDGTVNPDIIKAQKSGRIFDIGHGSGSIVFRNAIPAIKQGYLPNSISTDLHIGSVKHTALSMLNTMAKFLNMGLTLEQVIECSTINPAREINRPELGNLTVGNTADIAVLDQENGNYTFRDVRNGKISGSKNLKCMMTLIEGNIVFDAAGIGYPYWEDIPKDDEYWVNYTGMAY